MGCNRGSMGSKRGSQMGCKKGWDSKKGWSCCLGCQASLFWTQQSRASSH